MAFNIFSAVFAFGILIVIHELGHFLAAKWMGVRVEKFSIGFPPRLFGKKIGDTDYCISAIPLGGYVKLSGMIDESMDTAETGADYEFNSKPVWKRIVIISAGVIMNFFLAVLIMIILTYSMGERITPSTEVGQVGKEGIAQKIGFKVGDQILALNNVPVTNWEAIQQEYIKNLNSDISFKIKRNEEIINLEYQREWFSDKNAEFLDIWYMPSAQVGEVQADMPAGKVGLLRGDLITEMNGMAVNNWSEMTDIIRKHPDDPIQMVYMRGTEKFETTIVPNAVEETDEDGEITTIGRIGVMFYYEKQSTTFARSVYLGFSKTVSLIGLNMRGIWWVVTGTKSAKEVVGGPIMIAKMAGDAAAAGWENYWTLIAALSAILAFFNILPIPALDGGHLMFLLYEAVFRKPLSIKTRMVVQQVGMALLLTLLIFILYVDLRRLFF
jgi:regulator of sigma E protease